MASITKYGSGWRAFVFRHGMRATKVMPTKREAQAWALSKEAELDRLKGSGGKTLGDAIDKYLATVSVTKRKPKFEEGRLTAFADYFGADTFLVDITSERIGEWRDFRLKTVQGATVLREANLYRNVFTVAVKEWRWIQENPFHGVRLPEQTEARHQRWGWKAIKRVLRTDSDKKMGEVIRAFHISLHTALRLNEVLTGEQDLKRNVIRLPRTKTTGYVEVPIPRRARKLFPCSFTVEANEASALFSRIVRQLQLGDLHFHDARASALTWLSRKVDILTLSKISRHKDLRTLQQVYYRETAEEIARRI